MRISLLRTATAPDPKQDQARIFMGFIDTGVNSSSRMSHRSFSVQPPTTRALPPQWQRIGLRSATRDTVHCVWQGLQRVSGDVQAQGLRRRQGNPHGRIATLRSLRQPRVHVFASKHASKSCRRI
ncbi:hypothetical protein BGW80DRAFT_1562460 [Lactifluus volemus]|nr:hypothetical protein BGW80DRAFT_1562460 [Lactifluus volemus]